MISFRAFFASTLIAFTALTSAFADNTALEQKLESQYALTKTTADRSDIVTAGAVLVLQKDNLLMNKISASIPPTNTYKDGKFSQGLMGALACKWCRKFPGSSQTPTDNRFFVKGEKFWVTKIEIKEDGVVFDLYTDPISDERYYSLLKFPFPKGSTPDPDKILSEVAEVVTVQADDASNGQQGAGKDQQAAPAAAPAPAAPAAAMAPIAAPPPPTDAPPAQPKTIAVGQTKDMVTANFGQPSKVVKLANKEIDYYPDMKVTFVKDKVTDVQ